MTPTPNLIHAYRCFGIVNGTSFISTEIFFDHNLTPFSDDLIAQEVKNNTGISDNFAIITLTKIGVFDSDEMLTFLGEHNQRQSQAKAQIAQEFTAHQVATTKEMTKEQVETSTVGNNIDDMALQQEPDTVSTPVIDQETLNALKEPLAITHEDIIKRIQLDPVFAQEVFNKYYGVK